MNAEMIGRLEREAAAFEYLANGAHLAAVVPKKDALELAAFLREVAQAIRTATSTDTEPQK